MLGPSRAGRQGRRSYSRNLGSRNLGQLAAATGACFVCAVAVSNCGFPQYGFSDPVAGSGGAGNAGGGAFGGVGAGSGAGTGGASAGTAGSGGAIGAAGEAGAAGAGGVPCVYPVPVKFPDHCFDGKLSSGETAADCGGECAPCSSTQACSKNSDCVSNACSSSKCSPIMSLDYKSIVADQTTPTPKFMLTLTYLDKQTPLQSIRIRYYFNHNAAAEPLVPLAQGTINPDGSQRNLFSSEIAARIYRYPPGPADPNGFVTDSVFEVTFPSSASLGVNAVLGLTLEFDAASNTPTFIFDQSTHYSFINGQAANTKIAVFRDDQLIWGTPPAVAELPDCAFVSGVNLNGPMVTVDGQPLQASTDAGVVYSGATYQSTISLEPAADTSTTTLVRNGFALGTATATWPIPNGRYWAYAWLTSETNTTSGQLVIQDNAEDHFYGVPESGFLGWSKVGPYSIDVLGGSVKLSGLDTVNIAGVELYAPAP